MGFVPAGCSPGPLATDDDRHAANPDIELAARRADFSCRR